MSPVTPGPTPIFARPSGIHDSPRAKPLFGVAGIPVLTANHNTPPPTTGNGHREILMAFPSSPSTPAPTFKLESQSPSLATMPQPKLSLNIPQTPAGRPSGSFADMDPLEYRHPPTSIPPRAYDASAYGYVEPHSKMNYWSRVPDEEVCSIPFPQG